MAETINLKKRLIGKEDINFDIAGIGETETFITTSGSSKSVTKINATHIPLTKSTRNKLNATNVEDALAKVSDKLDDFKITDVTTQDVVVDFLAEDDAESIQFKINNQKKNLNGHTITFNFPPSLDQNLFSAIEWNSFYNGMLVINGGVDSSSKISVYDRVDLGAVFKIKNCLCNVVIQNFYIIHQSSKYGLSVDGSSAVIIKNCSFSGIVNTESYAVYKSASNVVLSEITVNNDNTIYTNGDVFSVDGVIADKSGNIPLNALPKSGGIMTGSGFFRNVNDDHIYICGGKDSSQGAYFMGYGKDHPTAAGYVHLFATNGTNSALFTMSPTGVASINGKNIVRSINNINADAAGNVNLTAENLGALPTQGGIISGVITTTNNTLARKRNSDGFLYIYGATTKTDGAYILLTGKTYTENTYFEVGATNEARIYGDLNGNLKWNEKHIVRSVDGVNAGTDGNVTLNALPKSGGIMTGSYLSRNTNSSSFVIYGGLSGEQNGSYVALYGKEYSNNKGGFLLRASDGTNGCVLAGNANGNLIWGSKNVVRSVGGKLADTAGNVALHGVVESWRAADGSSWYRKWSDGWIEQGGTTSGQDTKTLPTAFTTTKYNVQGTFNTGDRVLAIEAKTTTTFYARIYNTEGKNGYDGTFAWYACGF